MSSLPPPAAPARLDLRFLLAHPAHFIALGFGLGLSPTAPGTVGTLGAWLAFALVPELWPHEAWSGVVLGAGLAGWWACTVAARHAGNDDPGAIVWDEVVAFWLVLWLLGSTHFTQQLVAFALFRFFDAVKIGPVGWFDRAFKGTGGWLAGLGILLDDLVAAVLTLLVMDGLRALWPGWS